MGRMMRSKAVVMTAALTVAMKARRHAGGHSKVRDEISSYFAINHGGIAHARLIAFMSHCDLIGLFSGTRVQTSSATPEALDE